MKALTVKNPWAFAIIHLGKTVENRSQATHFRGRIAIHTAKTLDLDATETTVVKEAIDAFNAAPVVPGEVIKRADLSQLGLVIGTVEISGCHHANDCRNTKTQELCSEWAQDDAFHWELRRAQPYANPQPARGMLGLWDWTPEPNPTSTTIHRQQFSTHPYSYFCSCGAQATGNPKNPAQFADHLEAIS